MNAFDCVCWCWCWTKLYWLYYTCHSIMIHECNYGKVVQIQYMNAFDCCVCWIRSRMLGGISREIHYHTHISVWQPIYLMYLNFVIFVFRIIRYSTSNLFDVLRFCNFVFTIFRYITTILFDVPKYCNFCIYNN